MTTLAPLRPDVDEAADTRRTPPGHAARRRPLDRLRRLGRQPDLPWFAPLLLLAGVVHAWGMFRSPQRVDDEGTYVAQAYAVLHFGELAHYTYWYDHPPLGWLQLAPWTLLVSDSITSVMAGRIAMLAVQLACVALVWALARRLHLSRVAAAVGVLLFSVSPLAIYFHRLVYLDNLAVLWTLAAFVLATARHHQLRAFCGAAACFAVAVLTKETTVLWLPPLAWLMWRTADPTTRRYTVTLAGALFGLMVSAYLVFALLKNELVPGPGRVSLVDAIAYQLFERASSGSVWDEDSGSHQTVSAWLGLDPVWPVLAGLATIPLLVVPRFRPLAAAFLLPVLALLRPGYLPIPYVIAILPFAALVVAAALDLGLRRGRMAVTAALALAGLVAGGAAAQSWPANHAMLTQADQDAPMAQAQSWLSTHVRPGERMLVDDAVWVDLVREGFDRDDVVWYFKADTDPAVQEQAPDGWRDYDYLMVTQSVRGTVALAAGGRRSQYGHVTDAYRHSHPVAEFGTGDHQVQIRRIGREPDDEPRPVEPRPTITPAPPQVTPETAPAVEVAPHTPEALPPTPSATAAPRVAERAPSEEDAPAPAPRRERAPAPEEEREDGLVASLLRTLGSTLGGN